MENDPNPDRVKDPTGQYERNMPIFRDAKPSDGWKLAGLVGALGLSVAFVLWCVWRLLAG